MAFALPASAHSIADDLALANALADTAAAITTRLFRPAGTTASIKPDGSPVTRVDLLVEAALRRRLRRDRPGDEFVGEESGCHGHGQRSWYLDPIDGTASFARGGTSWRTLLALEDAGTVVIGLVSAPLLRERWWASRGAGAWSRSLDVPTGAVFPGPRRLAVSRIARLAQATVAVWPPLATLSEPLSSAAARLVKGCAPAPETGQAGLPGALLVAAGQLDGFLFAGAAPWDLAAMIPIVEEAGGMFTDVAGGRSLYTPAAVFSNGLLHRQILHRIDPGPTLTPAMY